MSKSGQCSVLEDGKRWEDSLIQDSSEVLDHVAWADTLKYCRSLMTREYYGFIGVVVNVSSLVASTAHLERESITSVQVKTNSQFEP